MPNSAPPSIAIRHIQIASRNQALIEQLKGMLAVPSELIQSVDAHEPGNKRLVLVDCASITWSDALEHLQAVQQETSGSLVALLNVPTTLVVDDALRWPALSGIFTTDMDDGLIKKGICEILDGGYWFARTHMRLLAQLRRPPKVENLAAKANLSNRELDVLRLTAMGKSNVEIAGELFLSHHTVKTHLYNLYRKLGVSNRTQAVHWYQQHS
ncbi:helix-turn-helix transcriptional regulator [Marinobacterium jannaschii]|uniref:helix-turn-helix transcriptional regulator n=1 Tax=Marinobacterium jannaschii TaxID=64970 RepID=UPI000482D57E|nr:response regulator transcription factor [Marinobacterium jannaschii]